MASKTRTDIDTLISTINSKTYADTIAGKIESIEDHSLLASYEASYLGLGDDLKLAPTAIALAGILNKGTIKASVKEGEAYTLNAGYYEGGTVTGIAGGGDYDLETPAAVTPTTAQQTITPSEGYYGLKQVTVNAIPSQYKDTTGTNGTTSADVLDGKYVVTTAGKIEGSMTNNGAVDVTLTTTTSTYTVPVGYHNGKGTVKVSVDNTVSITPSESEQTITAPLNAFMGKVTVAAIDKSVYLPKWTEDATAEAGNILTGKKAYVDGVLVTGTMTDNTTWDAASHTLNTTATSIAIPAGYHDGTGTVAVTLQSKTATAPAPGVAKQTITPDNGYLLSSVIVPALDSKYQDVSGVTAIASHVCAGYKFVDANGTLTTGTLADSGALSNTTCQTNILASGATGCTFLSGTEAHYTSVTASMDGTLYTRLAAI